MAKKLVAVFLMCIVVLAAVQVQEAQAEEVYKACYSSCHKQCMADGQGYTFCEMKCDTDCGAKEVAAKLESLNS